VKSSQLSHEAGSSVQLQNATERRLLAKSFTVIELEYLQQDPHFQEAVAEMHTLDAFEKTASFGHYLLIERNDRSTPSNIVNQNFNSQCHFE
jgi:hypothetical protein